MFPYKKPLHLLTLGNQLCRLIFILLFMLVLSGNHLVRAYQQGPASQAHLDQFDMLTDSSGWVLIGRKLFWTSDAGHTWTQISPSLPEYASVEAVQFIDSDRGWLLSTTPDSQGGTLFQPRNCKSDMMSTFCNWRAQSAS